jgi:hypothetical protein
MDNLDKLLNSAADDWRNRSKKPMRRSALAFIALGSGTVISGSRLPSVIGTALVGAVAAATWYFWPASSADVAINAPASASPAATIVEAPSPLATSEPAPEVRPSNQSLQRELTKPGNQPSLEAPTPRSSELSSPINPSARPPLSPRELAEERRLRELFRQAAAEAVSDPANAMSLFISVAHAYEARKNVNHARYALLQARDLAARGAGDSEQLRMIEESLLRLQQ